MSVAYSEACERNKGPLRARLVPLLQESRRVLEIGSGTGQHATYFAAALPRLEWICSDLPQRHETLRARLADAGSGNLRGPLALDVTGEWPTLDVDAVFTANTTQVMSWPACERMIESVAALLPAGGRFALYGPFHYGGRPVSAGNAEFDRELRARGGGEGIKNAEALFTTAVAHGLGLLADCAMPANNRLFCWEKTA